MDKQNKRGQSSPKAPVHQPAPAESRTPDPRVQDDSTWGQGAATALENLRRQNYRGHRDPRAPDRPSSK